MLLTDLLGMGVPHWAHCEITSITADSRRVKKGSLFVAVAGTHTDGKRYIQDAIKRGASAIVAPPDTDMLPEDSSALLITHDNPRMMLSILASRFYNRQPEVVVAVTGTNGKTSVAHFCRQMWQLLGEKSASIGTLGIIDNDDLYKHMQSGSLTTPDPVTLHEALANLAAHGVTHLALEASSHGLEQFRLDGVGVTAAGFTNLSRDHLDYHQNMENYLNAKLHLFDRVMEENRVAVLNADIPEFALASTVCAAHGHEVMTFGFQGNTFKLIEVEPDTHGQIITFKYAHKVYKHYISLPGEFQAQNLLCALGLVIGSGSDAEQAIATLPQLTSVPGRLEKVANHPDGAAIYVDYAHTPDALQKALLALRSHTKGRLIVLFGCGGDRDKGKRPQMGKIAKECADKVVITDDNPRSEDPAAIRKEILQTAEGALEIADRAEAIHYAIGTLHKGDVLLIAGKGHEKYQIIGDKTLPFDDAEHARREVNMLGGIIT